MNKLLQIYNKVNTFGNLNGMEFKILKPGDVQYTFTVMPEHESSPGVLHGGVMAAYMDAVMGVASLSLTTERGYLTSTVEFKINFLKPILTGQIIKGEGKVLREGKRSIVAEGKIYNETGELVATGLGTFNAYPAENSAVAHLLNPHKK